MANSELYTALIQQRQLLSNLNEQLTALSLNLPASADLWALKRQYDKFDRQLVETLSNYQHNQIDTFRPYPPNTPRIAFRESMRVMRRDSMRTIREHRYKIVILVLSLIVAIFAERIPKWIGTLFLSP